MPSYRIILLGNLILLLFVSACGKLKEKATNETVRPSVQTSPTPTPDSGLCHVLEAWDGVARGGLNFTAQLTQLHRRVFQRKTLAEGIIPVAANGTTPYDCVQASFVEQGTNRIVVDWTELPKIGATGYVSNITTPAGGWYTLYLRGILDGKVMTRIFVTDIGVGEVFITAGQSNSTFCGDTPQKSTSGFVSFYSAGTFIPCEDANFNKAQVDGYNGGSPWCLLGDELYKTLKVPVLIDPVGWGGTRVDQWVPNSTTSTVAAGYLFNRLLMHRNFFGANGIRAILWHQGESDVGAGTTQAQYTNRMNAMINTLKTSSGNTSNWMIAEVTYMPNPALNPYRPAILASQRNLVNNQTVFPGAQTDPYFGAAYRPDTIHFNTAGLIQHAKSWHSKILSAFFP